MLCASLTFTSLSNIPALGWFSLASILLIFTATLKVDYKDHHLPKTGQKREQALNRIYKWDYLIIILPLWLLLVILFSDNSDRPLGIMLMGIGYSSLILSSYNRRVDIPAINFALLYTCLLLVIIAVAIQFQLISIVDIKAVRFLYLPFISYIYLMFARWLIKMLTGSYPITSYKGGYIIGEFYDRYARKYNGWDVLWGLFNLMMIFVLFFIISQL